MDFGMKGVPALRKSQESMDSRVRSPSCRGVQVVLPVISDGPRAQKSESDILEQSPSEKVVLFVEKLSGEEQIVLNPMGKHDNKL